MVKRVTIAGTVVAAMAAFLAGPGAGAALADFVCPVIPGSDQGKQQREQSGQFITISGGDTSILPGLAGDMEGNSPVDVPDHATNGEGSGSPAGAHDVPGDDGYTAIWNTP